MQTTTFTGAAASRAARPPLARLALRQALLAALAIGLVWFLGARLGDVDPQRVLAATGSVSPQQWLAALALTAVSFGAAGRYDALVARRTGLALPPAVARRAGMAAVALSQATGFGVLTGALVRWRMLPDVTLWQAVRLSVAVATTFLAGWLVIAALAVVLSADGPAGALLPAAAAVLALAAALALASLRRTGRTPHPRFLLAAVALVALDTLAAALAFWVLLPANLPLEAVAVVPAVLLALGAGIMLATPGGIGPFEMALLALLPLAPAEPLLAAVLAWRIVYHALPAALAICAALAWPARAIASRTARFAAGAAGPLLPLAGKAQRSEALLLRQGELGALSRDGAAWPLAEAGPALATIGAPFGAPVAAAALITTLGDVARAEGRIPLLYKAPRRLAAAARRAGFAVLPVAREARLDPAGFDLEHPARAGLRRKLRRAARAGVRVTCPATPPLAELAVINARWVAAHGAERGVSMGRFAPGYVAGQRVYVASIGDVPVAFATFHDTGRDRTLDLLRHGPDTPDGTMHALVHAAIAEARRDGVPRLSLAAAPLDPSAGLAPAARHLAAILSRSGGAGLARFKQAFAPDWETLYIAAPGPVRLARAGLALALAIRRPAARRPHAGSPGPAHDDMRSFDLYSPARHGI